MHDTASELVRAKLPCPDCGSSDNLSLYSDGHGFCFTPGCGYKAEAGSEVPKRKTPMSKDLITDGEYSFLTKRKITEETCRKFGYATGTDKNGTRVQIAPYYDGRELVAQKLRYANKDFKFIGEPKRAGLFGQQLWSSGGKMVVITEGEIDCLTVSQLQGNKWPVVSIANGASSAKKAIQQHIEWLESFESVILMFDMDDAGQKAVEECVPLFSPGKCKVATLPYKDANECLLAGKADAVIQAIWGAKTYRPASVLSVEDALDEAIKMPEMGIDWPWPSLTKLTYGINRKCSYYLGAGVGIGKTNWAKELQSWLVNKQGLPVGVFMLEEPIGRTLKGIAGKFHGKPFHKPDANFTQEELRDAISQLDGKVFLYSHATSGTDWDSIKRSIRYMVVSCGVKDIFLDNLTVMVAHLSASEANDEINRVAKEIKELLQELDFTLYGFSHLNSPSTGPAHEMGGKVLESQFTGSRGLMRFANYMLGLERSKDPELSEDERNTAHLVLLKDREYGSVGRFPIKYNPETDQFLEPDPLDVFESAPATTDF